jgi:hypothetical protein
MDTDTMDHALYVSVAQWIVVSGLLSDLSGPRHDAHPKLDNYLIPKPKPEISGGRRKY